MERGHKDKIPAASDRVSDAFQRGLARHRRIWRQGLAGTFLLRLAGIALLGLAVYGLLDRFLVVPADARRWINAAGITALIALAVRELTRITRRSTQEAARRIDRQRADNRRLVLTAYELLNPASHSLRATGEDDGLNAFLVNRCIANANEALAGVPLTDSLPQAGLRQQARTLGLLIAAGLLLIALNPTAARLIGRRILSPSADAPPYSRYVFSITPDAARVTYGGHLELTATITGAPIKNQVWLLTRDGRKQHRTACFQETPDRFAQRLEHVVTPLDFCFTTGKARSPWQRVEVMLQPRIAVASLVVTPPAYSQLPPDRFVAGSKPLQGLRGSRIELTLTSNRPLLDGTATLQHRGPGMSEQRVSGRRTEPQVMAFEWTLSGPADIAVDLRDIQGTASATPFRLVQQEVPDAPPAVRLHEPEAFSLATPNVLLALRGEADDDLGLYRVELVQALVGFRDRIRPLSPDSPVRHVVINRDIDLSLLGVSPGDVLEFYAEAQDTHPGMAGLSASGIARVQIISEEEYAATLRSKITLQEFLQRYQAVDAAMKQLSEDLQALANPDATPSEKEALLAKTVNSAAAANNLFSRLARDFAVFDIEKTYFEDLKVISGTVNDAYQELSMTTAANPRLDALARHWRDQLAPAGQTLSQHKEAAEEVAGIAALMEAAVRFRQLVQQQESLVRSLARYETEPVTDSGRRLRTLGVRQADIQNQLADVLATIKRTTAELPPIAADFGATALQFVQKLEASGAEACMQAATIAAENSDGAKSHLQARLALERMKLAAQECEGDSGFGGMCNGQGPPKFGKGECQATLEQMLAAMMMRLLGGQGGEGPTPSQGTGSRGPGLGGDSSDGFWMSGNTPLNIPMQGPARTRFDATAAGVKGNAGAGGRHGSVATTTVDTSLKDAPGATIDSHTMPLDEVPPKYRDAVKRYFSTEE